MGEEVETKNIKQIGYIKLLILKNFNSRTKHSMCILNDKLYIIGGIIHSM